MSRVNRLLFGMALVAALFSAQAYALPDQEKLTEADFNRANLKLSLGLKMMIYNEGEIAVADERIHCDRRRGRGAKLRKHYCQTAHEFALEQQYLVEERKRHHGSYANSRPVSFRTLPSVGSEVSAYR